jgi:tRNA (cmo5U34)-methyltransferase
MKNVGDAIEAGNASWSFGGNVAETFDGHVSKSVPLYCEGHQIVCDLSDYFVKSDSVVYELGCSTGTLTVKMAEHNAHNAQARFVGIDIEERMITKARQRAAAADIRSVQFDVGDVIDYAFDAPDLVVAYYTVQFMQPRVRQLLVDLIYKSLKWGGAFIMFEKVRACDARFQDIMVALYNEYKLRQGYKPEEIFGKTRSLKGKLEPFSTQGNIDMLKRAGFVDIMTVMKYVSFEGFLAIK